MAHRLGQLARTFVAVGAVTAAAVTAAAPSSTATARQGATSSRDQACGVGVGVLRPQLALALDSPAAAALVAAWRLPLAECAAATSPPVRTSLTERLLQINTAAVADANKSLRICDERLRPIRKGLRFAGFARTVRCFNDFLTVIKALDDAQPGEVLVIDTMSSTRTVAGELFATEAKRRGLAAIVIDGPCRDTEPISQMDIPVWCTSIRPVSGFAERIYDTQVPVQCGGVVVHPGDIVFGDDDGIVVASPEEMAALIDKAEAVVQVEDRVLRGMHRGTSLIEQSNFREHYAKVQRGEPSALGLRPAGASSTATGTM